MTRHHRGLNSFSVSNSVKLHVLVHFPALSLYFPDNFPLSNILDHFNKFILFRFFFCYEYAGLSLPDFLYVLVTTHSHIKCVGILEEKSGPPVERHCCCYKTSQNVQSQREQILLDFS